MNAYKIHPEYLRDLVWKIRNNPDVTIQDVINFGNTYPECTMQDLIIIITGSVDPEIDEEGKLHIPKENQYFKYYVWPDGTYVDAEDKEELEVALTWKTVYAYQFDQNGEPMEFLNDIPS